MYGRQFYVRNSIWSWCYFLERTPQYLELMPSAEFLFYIWKVDLCPFLKESQDRNSSNQSTSEIFESIEEEVMRVSNIRRKMDSVVVPSSFHTQSVVTWNMKRRWNYSEVLLQHIMFQLYKWWRWKKWVSTDTRERLCSSPLWLMANQEFSEHSKTFSLVPLYQWQGYCIIRAIKYVPQNVKQNVTENFGRANPEMPSLVESWANFGLIYVGISCVLWCTTGF